MASTYSPNLRLELIGTGEQQGTWGITTNNNLGTLLEEAIGGYTTVVVADAGDTVLTTVNGGADESRNMVIELTGTISAARNVICPAIEKLYVVNNNTTGGFSVTFKVAGQTGVTIANGTTVFLYVNGVDAVAINPDIPNGSITTAKLGGDITTAGKALLDDADAAAQRTTLGLGTLSTQNANNVNITGGSITNVALAPTAGDSILSARALSLPSYIGAPGNYLKANYPLIGSLPGLQIYGADWTGTNIPSSQAANVLYAAGYGNGVWLSAYRMNLFRRSADNGSSWTNISTGGNSSIQAGSMAYGNGAWVVIPTDSGNSTGLRSTDNGLTWTSVNTGVASYPQPDIATDGAGTWMIVGSGGQLSRSLDNGATWATISSGTTNTIIGIAYGNGAWIFVTYSNVIRRSTDSGSSWTTISSPFGSGNYLSVATDGAGTWVAGHATGMIRSTNNGTSWSSISPAVAGVKTIATNNSGTWIGTNYGTAAIRSTDNGATWSNITINPTGTLINKIAFGGGRFLAVGTTSFMSSNGGVDWSPTAAQYLAVLQSLARSSNAAVAINNQTSGYYARSTDNGSSWSFVSTPIPLGGASNPQDVSFGNGAFVICGYTSTNAAFFRSLDNGLTWINVSPSASANSQMYRIATNGTGTWVAGGQGAKFYRSADNGLTWGSPFTTTPLGTANAIVGIASSGGNTWIAATASAVARSTDNGVTWSSVTTGAGTTITDVLYSNGYWYVISNGTPFVRYSTDDGVTWASSTNAVAASAIGADGQGRVAIVGSTDARISRDGGMTFSQMPSNPANPTSTISLEFFGTKIVAINTQGSLDGVNSETLFNVPSALASPASFSYLYTGQ